MRYKLPFVDALKLNLPKYDVNNTIYVGMESLPFREWRSMSSVRKYFI
jgi:hypothetical protein